MRKTFYIFLDKASSFKTNSFLLNEKLFKKFLNFYSLIKFFQKFRVFLCLNLLNIENLTKIYIRKIDLNILGIELSRTYLKYSNIIYV